MEPPRWESWIVAIRRRDADVVQEFWSEYGARLVRLADANLQQQLRRRVDAEDVVQSAFRTFLRRMEDGQFELSDDEQLWSLLCAITLNKVRLAARHHLRKKRGLDREHVLNEAIDAPAESAAPTPAEALALVDLVQQALDGARDEQERAVLQLKLEEFSNLEIAERVGCSERTVRRLLQRIKTRLERMLESDS